MTPPFAPKQEDRVWAWGLFASVLGHLLVGLLILFSPELNLYRIPEGSEVVAVTLVGAPALPEPEEERAAAEEPPEPAPAPEPASPPLEPEPEAAPVARPRDERPPEPLGDPDEAEVKRSLKKKTFNREQAMETAVASVEKKVEQDRSTAIQRALESVRRQMGEGGPRVGPPGAEDADAEADYLDEYAQQLKWHVNRNWAFPERLAGTEKELTAVIQVTIERDGRITDVWFERRSGNPYFDDSVQRAVAKSDPAPKLPDQYPRPRFTVGLVFTPPR
ncbi:MAG: TonB family protein [Deltaproteobacteria bacterium]|nr:TonB family protein [Deltaproteobacteria bacterium]